jgi:hypothetical protein
MNAAAPLARVIDALDFETSQGPGRAVVRELDAEHVEIEIVAPTERWGLVRNVSIMERRGYEQAKADARAALGSGLVRKVAELVWREDPRLPRLR